MKCPKCDHNLPNDAKFCFSCGAKIEAELAPLSSVPQTIANKIYEKYIEVFFNSEDDPKKKKKRDEYMNSISDSAYKLMNGFYKDFFDELINRPEFSKEFNELKVETYKSLRLWIYLQVLSGFQLRIARKIIEGKKITKPLEIDFLTLSRKVEEKFYVIKVLEYFDDCDRQLIMQDSTNALSQVKTRIQEIEKMSLRFINELNTKLVWATIYGLLISQFQDKQ